MTDFTRSYEVIIDAPVHAVFGYSRALCSKDGPSSGSPTWS